MTIDTISKLRIDFLKELGISIKDPQFFDQKTWEYGYNEILWQYLDHFVVDPDSEDIKLKRKTDFEDIYAFYQLDQKLKNSLMISLQLFEQSFKVALSYELLFEYARLKSKLIKANKETEQVELFNETYKLQDGRVINRGDLKARIRHIKQNYLEPFDGYNNLHSNKVEYWVLVKEMSFGVATNAFFLLGNKNQKNILERVFKNKISLADFENILSDIKLFRRRAAHNYRLIGIKRDEQYLYKLALHDLSLLSNQEPYKNAINSFRKICQAYLEKYPYDQKFLQENVLK